MAGQPQHVGGVLLLYRRPLSRFFGDATTIEDHIGAFGAYSSFRVHSHNTELGYPRRLDSVRFDAVVLHYSLFGTGGDAYPFSPLFERYLDQSADAYKVAFFHDEHTYCARRFAFINDHRIDCVFTLLEPPEFAKVYGAKTSASKIVSHLPGYVSDSALQAAERFRLPEPERAVDVGFRARPLAPYMGRDEKSEIGPRFSELAAKTDLSTDIEVSHESLLPGDRWFRFIAGCRTMLGVESGTTAFDLEDEILDHYNRLAAEGREVGLEDLRGGPLDRWEDRIYYRTIGPRHFEAAALGVCQVLFEGRYSGLMEPMVHYIPLRKDFANFDEVVTLIKDPALRGELAANAHRDLIASGEHTFEGLIERFDLTLREAGLQPRGSEEDAHAASRSLHRSAPAVAVERARSTLAYHPLLSRLLWRISRPILAAARRLRRARLERR